VHDLGRSRRGQDPSDHIVRVVFAHAADDRIEIAGLDTQKVLRQIAKVEPDSDGQAAEQDDDDLDQQPTTRPQIRISLSLHERSPGISRIAARRWLPTKQWSLSLFLSWSINRRSPLERR